MWWELEQWAHCRVGWGPIQFQAEKHQAGGQKASSSSRTLWRFWRRVLSKLPGSISQVRGAWPCVWTQFSQQSQVCGDRKRLGLPRSPHLSNPITSEPRTACFDLNLGFFDHFPGFLTPLACSLSLLKTVSTSWTGKAIEKQLSPASTKTKQLRFGPNALNFRHSHIHHRKCHANSISAYTTSHHGVNIFLRISTNSANANGNWMTIILKANGLLCFIL